MGYGYIIQGGNMEITLFGKQFFINRTLLIVVIIILMLGSCLLGYILQQVYKPMSSVEIEESKSSIIQSEEVTSLEVSSSDEANSLDEMDKIEEESQIKVYVVGCVNKPGVVTIKKGQVIDDVIKMAGGATKEADLENINLAYIINENTMIRIKPKTSNTAFNETSKATTDNSKSNVTGKGNTAANSDNSTLNNIPKSGVDIIKDSLGCVVDEEKGDSKKEGNGLVDINKASQAELESLPNIGPATAKAIIEYREKNGGFKKLTDIMKITGIKQKTYDKIKDYICIN